MNRQITLFALLLSVPAMAAADDDARATVNGNEFLAGGSVELDRHVQRNAFVSGGDVAVSGSVGRNLFAAGGDVRLEGEVDGDARLAAGNVRVSSDASIDRDATLAGGTIAMDGNVGRDLHAYGGRITLNGQIGGDVNLAGENLRLGPGARIGGELVYRSHRPIKIDPGAEVAGGIRRTTREPWQHVARGAAIVGGITVSLGMVLLGAVLVLGMPRFSREAGTTIRRQPWQALAAGLGMIAGVPVALVLLFVTIIGIPLALLLGFAYGALLMLGYLVGAIFLGDFALERIDSAKLASVWWRALFMLLAIVVIAIVHRIPVIGDLAWCLLFIAGVGAFTLRAWEGFRNEPAAA